MFREQSLSQQIKKSDKMDKTKTEKEKVEYATDTFIRNFYKNARKFKELCEKTGKEKFLNELRDEINEIIAKVNNKEKIPIEDVKKINTPIREKIRFLEKMMRLKPSYEGVGSVTEIDIAKDKQHGATHRALVFKVGDEILTMTKGFNTTHEEIAKAMYMRHQDLFEKNKISLSELISKGARLYVQKGEKNRISPKDNSNDEDFLNYTEYTGSDKLTQQEKKEETKKLRELILKKIISG